MCIRDRDMIGIAERYVMNPAEMQRRNGMHESDPSGAWFEICQEQCNRGRPCQHGNLCRYLHAQLRRT